MQGLNIYNPDFYIFLVPDVTVVSGGVNFLNTRRNKFPTLRLISRGDLTCHPRQDTLEYLK